MNSPEHNTLIIFIGCTIIGSISFYFAGRKGRNQMGWFILGFLFGIFALIALYFIPTLRPSEPTMSVTNPDPSLIPSPISSLDIHPVENKLWYYLDNDHQQFGPVSIVGLKDLWNRGLVEGNSFVWSQGMSQWEKIVALTDLKDALNKK